MLQLLAKGLAPGLIRVGRTATLLLTRSVAMAGTKTMSGITRATMLSQCVPFWPSVLQ